MTIDRVETDRKATEREATIEKLLSLLPNRVAVLRDVTELVEKQMDDIVQPVIAADIQRLTNSLNSNWGSAIHRLILGLETMGLVET